MVVKKNVPFTLVDKVILIHTLIININILDVFLYHIRNNKSKVFLCSIPMYNYTMSTWKEYNYQKI